MNRLRNNSPLLTLAGLLLLVAGSPVCAQESDSDTGPRGPIELAADSAEVNDATGVSIYRGNVVLTRGEMRIAGDRMTVITDAERELERIEVEGGPAKYRETLPDAEIRRAEAPRMEYYASGPERLILLEGARLWQGENTVIGRTITHYPAEARTLAEGSDGAEDRVNVTVHPSPDQP